MKLANWLTVSRIILSPVFIFFFTLDATWSLVVCIFLAAVIEFSDLFDGMAARKFEQVTDFGKLMDPFADSIARFTIFLCFLGANLAPIWMIAVLFYRDVLVSVIRVFAIKSGVVVSARVSGKVKAWFQGVAIFVVLIALLIEKQSWFSDVFSSLVVSRIITTSITIAMIVTVWSAFDYWNGNKHMVLEAMIPTKSDKTSS